MNTLSLNVQKSLLVILVVIAGTASAMTISYQQSAVSSNVRPSFSTGYATAGGYIKVIVNPTITSASYEVLLWQPNKAYPQAKPFQKAGPYSGPTIFNSITLDNTGYWRA